MHIVNPQSSVLTVVLGESVPVIKTPNETCLNVGLNVWDSESQSRSVLYSGTKVVRAKSVMESERVLAMVYRTGFNTTKGQLIRGILFPKPHKFKFYRDAFKFVGILAIIAVLGFGFTLYYFIRKKVSSTYFKSYKVFPHALLVLIPLG